MSTVTLGNVSCPFSLTMFVSFLIDDFPCQRSLYFLQARRNFSLPLSCHKVNIHMYESFVYTSVSDHCDEISEMSTSSYFKQISPLSLSLWFLNCKKKTPHQNNITLRGFTWVPSFKHDFHSPFCELSGLFIRWHYPLQ